MEIVLEPAGVTFAPGDGAHVRARAARTGSRPGGTGQSGRTGRVAFALTVATVCLLPTVWPGDTPWVNDEPNLIGNALRANAAHHLAPVGPFAPLAVNPAPPPAPVGLFGSFGVPYGPLPTQIYQALLLLTHDPLTLVVIRAILCTGGTAAGLLWLRPAGRGPPPFA